MPITINVGVEHLAQRLHHGTIGLRSRSQKNMPKHSKRFIEAQKLIEKGKLYNADEALELVKKTATTKFTGSVEVHVRLGINPKKSDQIVRATIVFPNDIGKTRKVAAFVAADKEKEAKEAGADIVGGEELITEISTKGIIEFDVAVATPDMMPKLAKLARVLGPKGLMPNPKTDTVGTNVTKMIEDLKKGKVAYKNDDTGIIHQIIGKTSLDSAGLKENLQLLMDSIKKQKPSSAKGTYLKSITLTTSMGPGIPVDTSNFT